jgi:CheY-like chemotaxis protein
MNKNGPIIVIEDDMDDQAIITDAFTELNYPNKIILFANALIAFDYLVASADQPFIILSDINLPKLNGIELKEQVQNNKQLRLKCIPYLFFTTSTDQQQVINAYSQSVQGFFKKPDRYKEVLRVFKNIVEYWKDCHAPNIMV